MLPVNNYLIKVKSYSINQEQLLGSGAFGIVFKGSDAKKNPVAAKRIDGNVHPRILTQDLDRFLQLDHPNVMNILDVERNEKAVWMMMPFCQRGDLNYYYKTTDVSNEINIHGMKQIAAGISYLHSQDVVHRDIKPGNILVASENPFVLQLTDFDVSKCLDPEVETSLMTSNVGTLALKAPEFFQRTSPGQIEYHRNVDIYAAGLTFLAILQAEKGKRVLIPQIETPMDDSELHVPSIGQLIAERIKYKVPELNIVTVKNPTKNIKRLISQMTCVNPEERLSAAQVRNHLNAESVLGIKKIKLNHENNFPVWGAMDLTWNGLLLVRVKCGAQYSIQVRHRQKGDLINEIPSMCNHRFVQVNMHPQYAYADHVLECCPMCQEVRGYNILMASKYLVHRGSAFARIFNGPGRSVFVVDSHCGLFKLNWDSYFEISTASIPPSITKEPLRICYTERHDMLMCTVEGEEFESDNKVIAVKLETGAIIWTLHGEVGGQVIKPFAITCDPEGNAYVSDGATNRILKINGLTGEVLSILLVDDEEKMIRSMCWSNIEQNITLRTKSQISTYFIPK